MYLELAADASRVSPINVEAAFELASFSAHHPAHKDEFRHVYLEGKAQGWGFLNFVETSFLKFGAYARNGHLLIEAKITVTP